MSLDRPFPQTAAIHSQLGAIFVSLELSRSTWLVTSLSPGTGEKLSKRVIKAGDVCALLARLAELRHKALARTGTSHPIIVIQEAGLDGFWLHRVLEEEGCESHVVDAASVAAPRRRRRAKTDRIDGEGLLRALLAFKRGEPRVCSMVRPPTPEAEDERRMCRERAELIEERIRHVNRIKGLLFSQGVGDYEPLRRERRKRLVELRTGEAGRSGRNLKRRQREPPAPNLSNRTRRPDPRAPPGRWPAARAASESADRARTRPARIAARADQGGRGRPRQAARPARRKPKKGRNCARRGAAFACRPAHEPEGRRAGVRRFPLDRRTLPLLRQPPAGGRLPRPHAVALAKRKDRARAGRVEGGQSAAANENAAIGVAVAATSTAIGAGAVVSSAPAWHDGQGRTQAADRRARPQAVRGAVEIHQRRRRHRRSGHENLRLTSSQEPKSPSSYLPRTDQPRPIRVGEPMDCLA